MGVWECACICVPMSLLLLVAPHSYYYDTYQPGTQGCWSKRGWIWTVFVNIPYLILASSSEEIACADTQGLFKYRCRPWPMFRLFFYGLKHFPGASSGQMWPGSHARYPCPAPFCSQDKLWGISHFSWGHWQAWSLSPECWHSPRKEDFSGLAWRNECRLSWGWGLEENSHTFLPPVTNRSCSDRVILLFEKGAQKTLYLGVAFYRLNAYYVPIT